MCKPNEAMMSTNLNDAKLECSANPNCHMFFHDISMSYDFTFAACESTASIRTCTKGNIVYTSGITNTYIIFVKKFAKMGNMKLIEKQNKSTNLKLMLH